MKIKTVVTYSFLAIGLCIAGYMLYRTFKDYTFSDVVESLAAIPATNLLLAAIFTVCSYVCLTGFDWTGVRYVEKDLSYPRIALASFVALSIGQSVGLAGLSSGGLRYRYYAHWGMDMEDVAKIILLSGITVALGMAALSGMVMIINPQDAASVLGLGKATALSIGIAALFAIAGYIALAAFIRVPLKVYSWTFQMPSVKIAIAQVCISTTNFACVSACLRELLSANASVSYLKAATAFVLANLATLITHAPGGLGVLEATVQHVIGKDASVGGLIAFRVIYFFVPLFIGIPLAIIVEAMFKARKSSRSNHAKARML